MIVDDMAPYVDDTFALLAEQMIAKQYDYFRVAGFTAAAAVQQPQVPREARRRPARGRTRTSCAQALAALANSKDPASIPAIKAYLTDNDWRASSIRPATPLKQVQRERASAGVYGNAADDGRPGRHGGRG